jgi:carbon-monoxide dehydrogenase medium subunit
LQASRYEAPVNVEEAVALLAAQSEARVLAGGTDLIVQMHLGAPAPGIIVDVKRIPRLNAVELDASGLVLGAAVPAADVFGNESIRSLWPGLAEATDLIGSSQIQGRATWAGNLCNASPAADAVPALVVCNAEAIVAGPNGERSIAVEDFTTGPGQNVLERGEFVVEFKVPAPEPKTSDAYLRLIPRSEMDIAVVGAAVALSLDGDGIVTTARVSLAAVAPTVLLVPDAAEALVGSRLDGEALERAAAAASAAADPIDDRRGTIEYRTKISGVLTRRSAKIAYERALAR